MEDKQIIQLFWQRNEKAIAETERIHGKSCRQIASRILSNPQDIDECINDALLHAWNAIPPAKPLNLAAFMVTLTRNIALNIYNHNKRQKRGGEHLQVLLDELADSIHNSENVEGEVDERMLIQMLEKFLDTLSDDAQTIFIQRYITMLSIKEIASRYGLTESKVKVTLSRTRKRLRKYLKQEGWI